MALALMLGTPNGTALASGEELAFLGDLSNNTTESLAQLSATEDCVFSKLRARIVSGGSGTNNFQFRDAGANGAQLATRAGTGDCEDATNSDTLQAGDLFNVAYTDTGTNSVCSWVAANVAMASGYGAFLGGLASSAVVLDVASSTRYLGLGGAITADGLATEADVAFTARGFTSFEALQVRVTANARVNDSTFRNRINNADGAGLITFGAGVTGLLTDTVIGDTISDGQVVAVSVTLDTGVQDLTVRAVVGTLKSTDTEQDVFWMRGAGLARAASATAHYLPLQGFITTLTLLTEAQARAKPGFAGTAKNLRCYLTANTYTSNATLKLMKNGVAAITVTLTAGGGAGWYENTTDTVTFNDTDEFSYEFDEGGSGSATITQVGVTLAPTVAGAAIPFLLLLGAGT